MLTKIRENPTNTLQLHRGTHTQTDRHKNTDFNFVSRHFVLNVGNQFGTVGTNGTK